MDPVWLRLLAVIALASCEGESTLVVRATAPRNRDHRAPSFEVTDATDADADGIPDQLEDYLIGQFAPEVRLPRDDWTRPANVDWYLPLVRMRFAHPWCRDHEVLGRGAVTAGAIWRQQHPIDSWLCSHTRRIARSGAESYGHDRGFFLTAGSRDVYRGIPVARSDEWRVYAHVGSSSYVRPSDRAAAAYDIQIWFFYPYNVGAAGFNHEADWEHVTISVSSDLELVSVYFAAHRSGRRIDDASQLAWADPTHLVVYSARGTHASYPTPGAYTTPVHTEHCDDGGPRWQTWKNAVNLGERDHVLAAQDWARYDGRWGRTGWFEITTGPVGPMFSRRWTAEGSEYPVPRIAKRR